MTMPLWLYQLSRCLFPRRSPKSRHARRRPPVPPRVRLILEGLEERLTPSTLNPIGNDTPAASSLVSPAAGSPTITTASPASIAFSSSAQSVTLTATVTSSSGTVNEGSVQFTILQNSRVIGTATSGTVASGSASVSYSLPAGTDAGAYTIQAAYSDTSGTFASSSDRNHQLTVTSTTAATTTTAATNQTATFNSSAQNVTLSATVTSTSGTVNEGTVTFFILLNGSVIGTSTSGTVSGGSASATYSLPGGTSAGTYTIEADYSDSTGAFAISSDTTHNLTVNAATTTVKATDASATFSTNQQTVTLTATVTSSAGTVNEGSVQFTILQGSTVIGTATSGSVNSSGQASVNYSLPAGTAVSSYTIQAVYSDTSGNFASNTDSTHKLTVGAASTTTSAGNATAVFSQSNQSVTLSASVTSSSGTVNEGSVTFTLLDSNGNTIGTATSGTVTSGSASVSYLLPGGTATGTYTIEASYTDSAVNFSSSTDSSHTLSVNSSSGTSITLSAVNITPNLANGTAQVQLTAQVTNPGGTVGEGTVTFTMAGVSATGDLVNGMTIVTLTVPIQSVIGNSIVSLDYTDTSVGASFGSNSASTSLYLNAWNALLTSNLSFASDGTELNQTQVAGQSLYGFAYSAAGLLSQINASSIILPVTYTNVSGNVLVTIEGIPWQFNLFDASGNFLGLASLAFGSDGSPEWLIYSSTGQIVGTMPV